MKRREFLSVAGTTAVGMTLSSRASAASAAKRDDQRPNILFIMTDQQHSGMMSCTGNPHLNTPAMDSLARDGIRFERAYSTNPVCVPSRISMATGMMAGRLGVLNNGMTATVPKEVDDNSLGKLFKKAGYDTFYGGKTHMCPELHPPEAGYDIFERDQRDLLPEHCTDFLRQKREKPFFAVASFINPHDICYVYRASVAAPKNKPNVDELFRQASKLPDDQLPPLPPNHGVPELEPSALEEHMSRGSVTPAITMREEFDDRTWRIFRWIYCRLTEHVDAHIGKILDTLRETGQEDNTLIVFTSDHGDMDACHRLASKGLYYEESVKVPMLIKMPGAIPGGQVDEEHLVSTGLDILPTVCDYAGIAQPKLALGSSLRPISEGNEVSEWRRFVVSENHYGRMVRTSRFKYCIYETGEDRESLIDLQTDPGEMSNLAALPEYREVLNEHRRYLLDWIDESGDEHGGTFAIEAS